VSDREIVHGQQWVWVGRDRRVTVRVTDSFWIAVEKRAAALNLPWSAALRFLASEGLKVTESQDEA
jgi:hypothetical protein